MVQANKESKNGNFTSFNSMLMWIPQIVVDPSFPQSKQTSFAWILWRHLATQFFTQRNRKILNISITSPQSINIFLIDLFIEILLKSRQLNISIFQFKIRLNNKRIFVWSEKHKSRNEMGMKDRKSYRIRKVLCISIEL